MLAERLQNQGVSLPFGAVLPIVQNPGRSASSGNFINIPRARPADFGEGRVRDDALVFLPNDNVFAHARRTLPPETNPERLDPEQKSPDCNISVSFKQDTFYNENRKLPNGVGIAPETQIGPVYGLGFTVSGSVPGER
jgi:hypothetical protein